LHLVEIARPAGLNVVVIGKGENRRQRETRAREHGSPRYGQGEHDGRSQKLLKDELLCQAVLCSWSDHAGFTVPALVQ
jgi:hypothetical protein